MTVRRFKELISALNLSERDYNCDPFVVIKARGRKRYEAILVENMIVKETNETKDMIALPIVNAKIRTAVTHAYPDRTIHLTLIDCEPAADAEPQALEHEALGWFTAEEALKLDFCPADVELLPVVFELGEGG